MKRTFSYVGKQPLCGCHLEFSSELHTAIETSPLCEWPPPLQGPSHPLHAGEEHCSSHRTVRMASCGCYSVAANGNPVSALAQGMHQSWVLRGYHGVALQWYALLTTCQRSSLCLVECWSHIVPQPFQELYHSTTGSSHLSDYEPILRVQLH